MACFKAPLGNLLAFPSVTHILYLLIRFPFHWRSFLRHHVCRNRRRLIAKQSAIAFLHLGLRQTHLVASPVVVIHPVAKFVFENQRLRAIHVPLRAHRVLRARPFGPEREQSGQILLEPVLADRATRRLVLLHPRAVQVVCEIPREQIP